MVPSLALLLALVLPIEDVTLPNGVRVIVSVDHAAHEPAVAVSGDRRVVAIVGDVDPEAARAPYASWPRPTPSPEPALGDEESWQVRPGPAQLVMEWPSPPDDDALMAAALLGGSFERAGALLRLIVDGGWPPAERRRVDGELARLAQASFHDLGPARDRCAVWASPPSVRERAQRLLEVTLVTGNPRKSRELPERCVALTVAQLIHVARALPRRGRRVRMIIPQ